MNELKVDTRRWNQRQVDEALSETNRYYYRINNGRDGSRNELILWYIANTPQLTFFQRMDAERIQLEANGGLSHGH